MARRATHLTVVSVCSLALLNLQDRVPAGEPHAPCSPTNETGPHIDKTVYEGHGLEGVDFGISKEEAEALLGPAEGGSEKYLRWNSSGIMMCFCGGQVKDIHFLSAFRGSLHASGLGIGSTLDEVEAAYGAVTEEKVVDSVCGWMLDRVLLIRGNEQAADEPAYKLSYYDLGLFFLFDEEGIIGEFGVFPSKHR